MPDWGTRIIDAGGSFHDVAKNAFDSLTSKARQPLNTTNAALRESFADTFSSFKKHAADMFESMSTKA